jgi:hypothetical protein
MGLTFYNKENMAVKTFGTEVLTSADTNTYLANAGLVYVTSATIGSGVTSITVNNAFSATYDNYRIVVSGGTSSNFAPLAVQLGTTGTGYYYSLVYASYATNAVAAACAANAASVLYMGQTVISGNQMSFEIQSPFLAAKSSFAGSYYDATNAGHCSAYLNKTT